MKKANGIRLEIEKISMNFRVNSQIFWYKTIISFLKATNPYRNIAQIQAYMLSGTLHAFSKQEKASQNLIFTFEKTPFR